MGLLSWLTGKNRKANKLAEQPDSGRGSASKPAKAEKATPSAADGDSAPMMGTNCTNGGADCSASCQECISPSTKETAGMFNINNKLESPKTIVETFPSNIKPDELAEPVAQDDLDNNRDLTAANSPESMLNNQPPLELSDLAVNQEGTNTETPFGLGLVTPDIGQDTAPAEATQTPPEAEESKSKTYNAIASAISPTAAKVYEEGLAKARAGGNVQNYNHRWADRLRKAKEHASSSQNNPSTEGFEALQKAIDNHNALFPNHQLSIASNTGSKVMIACNGNEIMKVSKLGDAQDTSFRFSHVAGRGVHEKVDGNASSDGIVPPLQNALYALTEMTYGGKLSADNSDPSIPPSDTPPPAPDGGLPPFDFGPSGGGELLPLEYEQSDDAEPISLKPSPSNDEPSGSPSDNHTPEPLLDLEQLLGNAYTTEGQEDGPTNLSL